MATELRNPPTDAISRISFAPGLGEDLLLVSSWDSKMRLYDIVANEVRSVQQNSCPILDCCFMRDSKCAVFGGLSREVRLRTFDRTADALLGTHEAPVRCVDFHIDTNAVFSGSWDKTVKAWDPRMKTMAQDVSVSGKVFCMAVGGHRLVVGDSDKKVSIFDVRKLSEPEQLRENILRYQYRAAKCFPDASGFALSSIEGRVAWEYFSPGNADAPRDAPPQKKYAFKCHREKTGEVEMVYPVNALAFHPIHGTFATGGGDGGVSVWDGYNKRRLWRLSFPASVTSLSFSSNGGQLAIAVSYDFSQGPKEREALPTNQITVRQVKADDVRPRAAAPKAPQ